jgi:hypothetical protein
MVQMDNSSGYYQPEEEKYLHQYCDSTAVFWQDGVAHCITCGQPYPPYEPVTLYLSQEFSVATYYNSEERRQIVFLVPVKTTDPAVSVEEAEAIGKALLSVPRIKVSFK